MRLKLQQNRTILLHFTSQNRFFKGVTMVVQRNVVLAIIILINSVHPAWSQLSTTKHDLKERLDGKIKKLEDHLNSDLNKLLQGKGSVSTVGVIVRDLNGKTGLATPTGPLIVSNPEKLSG